MQNKVILISVDGMRPDAFLSCDHPYIHEIMKKAYYTIRGRTVMPSVTLPCHMSMFHSVTPQRHGITTNVYIPMARPLNGLLEQLKLVKADTAMFYTWEELRDLSRPSCLTYSELVHLRTDEHVDNVITDKALARIRESKPDFVFLYLGELDDKAGHSYGWMSPEYYRRLSVAVDNIQRVVEACGEEYTIVITADHGGHDRTHGTEMPEDMTIPMFYIGKAFEAGKRFEGGSILDIAPTIAKIMGIDPADEWEGTPVI